MADILGNATRHEPPEDNMRGYVGTRYEVTPAPSPEAIADYVERLRREEAIKQAGKAATTDALGTIEAATKELGQVNTTRPGWWF